MQIVNFFYELAREHKLINGFIYGRSYEKGIGNEAHPIMWLDDPITGTSIRNTIRYTVNLDILGLPTNDDEVLAVQTAALNTGLSIVERINQVKVVTGLSTDGFSFITLRDYYDNAAAGQRFTINVIAANPVNRCADDFDPSKQFPTVQAMPDFATDNPDGCAIFNDGPGLPNFKLSI